MELLVANSNLMLIQANNAELRKDLQNAAREIRDQVRKEIQQQAPERHQIVVGTRDPFGSNEIPPQAVEMALGFFFTVAVIIIGLPISRAFARRMDRKAVAQVPAEVTAQLGQLTQAVDAIALEVERISEGQRFATRLLSEQRDAARPTLAASTDR
ncbi:MAG TPA: hypothetical protein VNO75_10140 [Gemmatimonadaceae bacterium]|nr:hypothetical protein [Gemmatimonadaceae bacterium]